MATGDDYKVTKLNGNNYHSWCIRVKAVLIQKGHWEAIIPGYGAVLNATEQLKNDKALSYIILAVEDSVLDEIESCLRAKEAWELLEEAYTKYGLLHALHARRDIHNSKKTENITMQDYINDIIEKNKRLKNSGFAFDDRELALLILMGLPPIYDQLILHFEQQEDSLTTKEVKRKLLLEERRVIRREEDSVKVEKEKVEAKAYSTQQNKREAGKDENRTPGNYRKYVKCFCCGAGGHIARDCYFNPESPNYKKFDKKDNEVGEEKKTSEAKLIRGMQKCNIEYTALRVTSENCQSRGYWYLDSAADEYMCNDITKFEDLKPCARTVRVADDRLLEVKGTGSVKIKLCKENGGKHLVMKDVSYIPDLTDNLLSVGKLTEAKIMLTFKDDTVQANRGNEPIFTGERHGRMYRVYEESATAKLIKTDDFELIHRRMGHVGKNKIKIIVKAQGGMTGEDTKIDTMFCEVCVKGKMKKKPFHTSNTKTTQPLELVHSDIMGPIKPESKGGARYVVTFTDDYSRYSKIYFLKMKNEVAQVFPKYHRAAEIETGHRLKMLRSDNGREYVNNDLDQYLQKEGIARQLTVPYNPQQNGVAERLNQTLTNMACCLLIQGNLPKGLWAEAIHTANYLHNRCPSSAIEERIPIELWCKEKAKYDNMKIFGCKVWRYLEKEKRSSKFDEKARLCIFVGYPDGVKGFKVWDYEEDKFYVSRDVKFEENVFPFQIKSDKIPEKIQEEIQFATLDEANDELGGERDEEILSVIETIQEQPENDEIDDPEINFEEPREVPLRRSQRMLKPKVCGTCSQDNQSHCSQVEHSEAADPKTLQEALESPDSARWKQAMKKEIEALEENCTWKIIRRPKDAHVIQGKWVFKKKKNENNKVIEYKARLVARGFQQIPDLEFDEVYSPVVKLKSVRLILAIAAQRRWPVYHFDITSAYLNGILDKTVLMELPKMTLDKNIEEWVCSLNKGLYGLKQGGRQWNQSIDEFLQQCDLQKAKSDPCVYFNHEGTLMLALHVDDIMMACKNEEIYQMFGNRLKERYKSKDLGEVTHLLSMRISRNGSDIAIDQSHLIEEILKHYQMEDAKPASTPLDRGVKFKRNPKGRKKEGKSSIPYRQLLGSLMYLANCTRPDLSFATSYMSQFNEDFDTEHWASLKHILRYLRKTKDLKLTYCASDQRLHGYCDADWGSDPQDRRSFGGFVFKLASGSVTWCSKKQRVTALSSTEAEFLQMVQSTRELVWLRMLLTKLQCEEMLSKTAEVFCDNQGAIYMAKNDVVTDRAKHIEIVNFFVRDHVRDNTVSFVYVPTQENIADALTKIVPKRGYELFCEAVNLCQH